MAVCCVLLAGFRRLDAELLMAGLANCMGTGVQTRLVPERQLAEMAAACDATAVLLGENLHAADKVIDDCLERLPALVIMQVSSRGSAARLVRQQGIDLTVEQISIEVLALLLCGGEPCGPEPSRKGYLPS